MTDATPPGLEARVPLAPLLGYLNFSEGRPDPKFQKALHDAFVFLAEAGAAHPWIELPRVLRASLAKLRDEGSAAFRDTTQADAVLALSFGLVLAAYREHHRDLLAHPSDADLWQPYFLVRVCEAVLAQRGPWDDEERVVAGALHALNDFVGHRPVAVLESRPRGEPYDHERVRPIPVHLRGLGAAWGPYRAIVHQAMQILEGTSPALLRDASFDPALLDELAYDPRGYDFSHPAEKRANYCFGEWDPHHIDVQGNYRRFVIRQVTLDGLLQRLDLVHDLPRAELLWEAAAVLAGTILMASAVSGYGPGVHDSTTSLGTLVPRIARTREAFYAELMKRAPAPHAERLDREARHRKQPFAGARQHLNQFLGQQRALHLQQRHLAMLFAEMGWPDASRRQVRGIHAASVRMLAEIQNRLSTAKLRLDRAELSRAADELAGADDLLQRGIACGAVVDPWNILGFQGQFPRSPATEDSVRDHRIDELTRVVGQMLGLYARLLSEGAAQDGFTQAAAAGRDMLRFAAWWDRFATTSVSEVPHVHGSDAVQSAQHVAQTLRLWRQRGEASADLGFWREQLEGFRSPKAFALVVEALLTKSDLRASMALLMTWMSQSEQVPLEEGEHSFHQLSLRWMLLVGADAPVSPLLFKFFDHLEANAEDYWHVPSLDPAGVGPAKKDDDEDSLYGAAYEEMTYQDSTDDGEESDVAESGPTNDFELKHEAERLEKRLQFLATLARLWTLAVRAVRQAPVDEVSQARVRAWRKKASDNHVQLGRLLDAIHQHDLPKPSGSIESMVDYDSSRHVKEKLLAQVIGASLDHALALSVMAGALDDDTEAGAWRGSLLRLEKAQRAGDEAAQREALAGFVASFRDEPLLYTPLSQGGHPRLIQRASLAQIVLRGLLAHLPGQGLLRETYQLIHLARRMEAEQPMTGPRITEFDRLFQACLQAVVETVVAAAQRDKVASARMVDQLEDVAAPFLHVWQDHSQTLRVGALEMVASDKDWNKLLAFIQRHGRDLFNDRFLSFANVRGILHQGVGAYFDARLQNPDAEGTPQLIEELGKSIARADAERYLQVVLQAVLENYEHLRDFNATTTQSDYGENLHVLMRFLRLKASYERSAWQMRPLNVVHEVLARHDGGAAALWRTQIQELVRDASQEFLKELDRLERQFGIRLTTIRDRLEERFVKPMEIDRLCALIGPATAQASGALDHDTPCPLEEELKPFAAHPVGVGQNVPAWLLRLEAERERVQVQQTPLAHWAELVFETPKRAASYDSLVGQLKDWEKLPAF